MGSCLFNTHYCRGLGCGETNEVNVYIYTFEIIYRELNIMWNYTLYHVAHSSVVVCLNNRFSFKKYMNRSLMGQMFHEVV